MVVCVLSLNRCFGDVWLEGQSAAKAAWVPLAEFKQRYPSYQLEDELIVQAGRDVMHGRQYKRHHRRNSSSKLGS
ncbi:hypothetical protein U9M48_036300 [Paspalum notatum var. saurae]|uniref:Uncharacterized protein n=1 Tax=Paspalum notatum var. saurae TaxID=547442 RepID=A0AAQ3UD70_PASNO